MAATKKTRDSRSSTTQLPSDGAAVCRWIEGLLVHGDGDCYGKPFRLTTEQKRLIWRLYERYPTGRRRVKRAVIGRPKGYGKTELAAAIALEQLCGPTAPTAPDIPVAAASFEQADLVFGACKVMASEGPLARYLEVYDTEILRRDGPGRIYRVAAVAGTNDGGRHSHRVADEVHEWEGRKERVHLVLTNGLAKRQDSWATDWSTAGSNLDSLLGRMYLKGKQIEAGELVDDRFLFDWIEHPDPECDLSTEAAVRAALEVSYRAAGGHVDLDQIVARFYEIPEFEFRRYYLNQFTATADRWLPAGAWEALTGAGAAPPPGTRIWLGFDGSYNNDSTALVGAYFTDAGVLRVFVVGHWERPERHRGEWLVPREEVKATVKRTMETWRVAELACDPPGWVNEIEEWGDLYGETVTIKYQTNRRSLMADACSRFYTMVTTSARALADGEAPQLEHDGNAALTRHLANSVVKETTDGAYITKELRSSPRKIDLAVAAVVAVDRAMQAPPPSVYETRGMLFLEGATPTGVIDDDDLSEAELARRMRQQQGR